MALGFWKKAKRETRKNKSSSLFTYSVHQFSKHWLKAYYRPELLLARMRGEMIDFSGPAFSKN